MDQETQLEKSAPRVAFLGFCDRAEVIAGSHPAFQHLNLLGLSKTRAFLVFPASLAGTKFAIAVFNPIAGEQYNLIFRQKQGQSRLEMNMQANISEARMQNRKPDIMTEEETELHAGSELPGWFYTFGEFPPEFMITEPGCYEVLLDGKSFVDTVNIIHAATPALTEEDIAAIRSNPLAHKFIRISIGCKLCPSKMCAYTGIERSERLEREGWQWSQEILDDRFKCSCGATNLDLKYIKTGLHGLLRPNYSVLTDGTITSVRLYEDSVLQEHCKSFRKLIDSDAPEEKVQQFLKAHEIFFSPFAPSKLMVKKSIQGRYVLDFAILNERHELLLIEIERPGLRLMKGDRGITADLQHAIDQVRQWLQDFDDHKPAILDSFGIRLDEVAKIRGIVVAGRTPKKAEYARLLHSMGWERIDLLTYDDLLDGVVKLVGQIANA